MSSLEKLSKIEMLDIHNKLNRYEWDERLGEKPHLFDEMPDFSKDFFNKYRVIKPYMKLLGSKLSEKEVLRYHHLNNLNRTEDEFNWWWLKRKVRIMITGSPI